MTPFRPYLSSVHQAQAIYKRLVQSSQAFNDFIARTEVVSRENTQATGGFRDFLSEPWQRAGRYRLMLDRTSCFARYAEGRKLMNTP